MPDSDQVLQAFPELWTAFVPADLQHGACGSTVNASKVPFMPKGLSWQHPYGTKVNQWNQA